MPSLKKSLGISASSCMVSDILNEAWRVVEGWKGVVEELEMCFCWRKESAQVRLPGL